MVSVASNERDLGVQYSSKQSGGDIAVLKYQNNHHWASSKNSAQRYSLPPSKHQHKPIDAGVTVNSKLPPHRKFIQYPKTSPRNHLSVPLPSYTRERPPSGGSHHFDSIKSVATNTFSSFLSSSPGAAASNDNFSNPTGNSNAVRILKQGSTLHQQPEIRYRPMSLVKSIEAKSVLNDLNAIAAASQKPRSKSLISLPKGIARDNRDSSVPAGHRNGHGQRHRMPATNPNQNAYPVSSIPNEKSRVVLDKSFAILNSKQRHASSKDRHVVTRIKSAKQLRSMVRDTPAVSSGSGENNATNGNRSPVRKSMSTYHTGSPYSNGVSKARNNAIERNASKIASAVKNSSGERAKTRGKSARQPKMRLVKTIEDTTESLSNCKIDEMGDEDDFNDEMLESDLAVNETELTALNENSVVSGGLEIDDDLDDDVIDDIDDDFTEDDALSEGAGSEFSVSTGASDENRAVSAVGTIAKPAMITSVFSNCPPVINFSTKNERLEPLSPAVRKLLKWKMSSITPIVVRNTVQRSGFKSSKKSYDWIGYFGKHMKSSGFRSVREYQKVNHFPGSFQLGRKDRLWRNLSRMQARYGKKEFSFVPQTYVLPWDKKLLKAAWDAESASKQKYILKPPASARGIGIKVINKWNQIPMKKPVLVQKYLHKPYLINGSKFDLRLYVYVTSFDPLRIYMFHDGLVRFATIKYSSSMKHLSNRYMHLTNYSVNKKSGKFEQNDDVTECQGHKWSILALWGYFREKGIDTDKIWEEMKNVVIKTIISVEHFTNSLIKSNCRKRYCCHELFGFDIMLDERLRPWVLEVNISPSLHSNSPLDVDIKGPMVKDMFNLAGFLVPDKKQVEQKNTSAPNPSIGTTSTSASSFSQDKRKSGVETTTDTRIKHTYFAQHHKHMDDNELASFFLDVLTINDIQMLVESEDEVERRGDFQQIFPNLTRKYLQFFEHPRYYNWLLHVWEMKFRNNKSKGRAILESFCRRGLHLPITEHTVIPPEHIWTPQALHKPFTSPRTDLRYLPSVNKSSTNNNSPYGMMANALVPSSRSSRKHSSSDGKLMVTSKPLMPVASVKLRQGSAKSVKG